MRLSRHISLIICSFILLIGLTASAHDGKKHKDSTHQKAADSSVMQTDSTVAHFEQQPSLQFFPTLHPLVVHIPIMLLILAAIVQWMSFIIFKRELTWTAWMMMLIGFIGAYASSTWFHPHTAALPPDVQHLLEEHEDYASYTQWFAGAALLLQSVNLFWLKRITGLNIIVAVLITASAVCVALAGHHGAELVHKHGVGAKGYMLEQHHH